MKQHEVNQLVAAAHAKGWHDVDDFDVSCFLGAKEILLDSRLAKYHKAATETVNQFVTWMETGIKSHSFARFFIPVEYILTDEEKAEEARLGAEYLKARSTNQEVK